MTQLVSENSTWNLSIDQNDSEVILETAETYLDKNIKISVSNTSIPSGVIMLWSGSSLNIPEGYVLCDGNNGTPNLTDKFILGAGNSYASGAIGGEISHTHKYKVSSRPYYGTLSGEDGKGIMAYDYTTNSFKEGTKITTSEQTRVNDSTVLSYQMAAPHFMESEANVSKTNNLPPYYALCYIMKI